jgi:hypothetical protein
MNRRNLTTSAKTLVILFAVIGSFNVLVSATTLSPVFSTVSTSVDQGQLSQPSATQDISSLFKGIKQFLAPLAMNKQGKIHHMPSTFPSQSWDTRHLNHQVFLFL